MGELMHGTVYMERSVHGAVHSAAGVHMEQCAWSSEYGTIAWRSLHGAMHEQCAGFRYAWSSVRECMERVSIERSVD
jgi:hypothetical protein